MTAEDLKKSILQQAIQGKLVAQNPDDEPAAVLLERIRAEKARLAADGKIKRDKNESVIRRTPDGHYIERIGKTEKDISEEIPFEIPDSWEWVRLGTIVQIRGGKRIPVGRKLTTVNTDQIYIRVSDMKNYSIVDTDLHFVPIDIQPLISAYTISKDDIYITVAGTIGRVGLVPNSFDGANLTENANKLTLYIGNKKELVLFLDSPFIQNQIKDLTTQVGQPKLAIQRIYNLLIPLPPLEEQVRIVAKIEELMLLVEEYGRAQSRLDELNSSLGDNIRKSVLQYAIQGKLVPQNPDDEPASVLLDRIRAEKAHLEAEGKIKRDKSVIRRTADGLYIERIGKTETDITDQIPFEIPDSWEWVRHNILFDISGGSQPPKEVFISEPKEGYIRLFQIRDYGPNPVPVYIPLSKASKFTKEGDILLARYGASLGKVFYAKDGAYNVAMAKVIPLFEAEHVYKPFLFMFYHTNIYQGLIRGNARSAQAGFNKEDLSDLFFPLPPLEEQKRIVERINLIFNQIEI